MVGFLTEDSRSRYNHCFKMQYKENDGQFDPNNDLVSSIGLMKDLDRRTSDFDHKNYPEPHSPQMSQDHMYGNDIDYLGGASWRTISRGSLEVIPDVGEGHIEATFK